MFKEADMRLSPALIMCIYNEKHILKMALRRNLSFRTQEERLCRGKSPIGELRILRGATREGVVIHHNRLTELDLTRTHGSTFVQRARS